MTGVGLILPDADQVAEKPEVLSQLPCAVVLALYARVLGVERECLLALAAAVCCGRERAGLRSVAADELLTTDEVA